MNNCADPQGGWSLGCRIDGSQAEYVRIPYADNGLTAIPDSVTDEAACLPGIYTPPATGEPGLGRFAGDTVAVIGAGPTGLCAMMCAAGLSRPTSLPWTWIPEGFCWPGRTAWRTWF